MVSSLALGPGGGARWSRDRCAATERFAAAQLGRPPCSAAISRQRQAEAEAERLAAARDGSRLAQLRREAWAGILDRVQRAPRAGVVACRAHRSRPPGKRVGSIGDEVQQRLLEAVAVHRHRRRAASCRAARRCAGARSDGSIRCSTSSTGGEVAGRGAAAARRRARARRRRSARGARPRRAAGARAACSARRRALGEQLQVQLEASERVADLVRDAGRHLAERCEAAAVCEFGFIGRELRGHVVQRVPSACNSPCGAGAARTSRRPAAIRWPSRQAG